jgi:hypothetical protein
MELAEINSQQAAEALSWLLDEDICAVQKEEDMAREVAEVDRLIERVDRELAESPRVESARLAMDHRDAQPYRRSRRRAERALLRSLPHRLPVGETASDDEEAA